MRSSRHVRQYHRHIAISYPISFAQKVYSILFAPLLMVLVMFILLKAFSARLAVSDVITFKELLFALGATLSRLIVAYILAVVVAIPLALLATSRQWLESIFLPVFDIMESVPILAFFPVIIVIFIRFDSLNSAAIFILFLSMVWNIVFTLVGGINVIPRDIIFASRVFGIKGLAFFRKVMLPSLVPQLITGSLLAFAQGWNLIIVAEVLHTYIHNGTASQDLFGLGSVLVNASANGQINVFILTVVTMVLAIAFMNFFIWQKLLHYAQRYKFE